MILYRQYIEFIGRSLYRERGLKFFQLPRVHTLSESRSLYRERGLKFQLPYARHRHELSLPLPGAWIEIHFLHNDFMAYTSLPLPGAWIEI